MNFPSFSPNLMLNKRKVFAIGLIAFLGGVLLGGALLNISQIPPFFNASGQPLLKFSSYEELVNFVNTSSHYSYFNQEVYALSGAKSIEITDAGYSTTNIQVQGVDEADFVKTDGAHLYIISSQKVFILKASPIEELRILSKIEINGTLHGIFITEDGDKLVIFGSSSYETSIADEMLRAYYWPYSSRTFVKVYDISNKTSPVSTRNVTLDGSYFSSRMIDNYVYAVINEPAVLNITEVNLPKIYYDSGTQKIQATDIYYSNTTDYGYIFTTIIAINVQNDAEEPTHETILFGATRSMYVSLKNIYITLPKQQDVFGIEKTLIYRLHIEASNIVSKASGEVPGRVLNQFSMDEYNDYFRIATTTGSLWKGQSQNHVYVLNMSLDIIGRLESLATGETIYSARFMDDKFYLVTFRKVDPLFVIDMKNPENPKVLGELKVTGYSDYLHPYDENVVIGVGKETIAAEEGDFSWYQGVKISLFNVSDPLNPTEIDKEEIGNRGTTSPVLSDHKAFLFDKELQLLAIPILIAEIDETEYPEGVPSWTSGDYVWQGTYIYKITPVGLETRGNITHIENGFQSSYYFSSPYSVKRTLYIGSVLYTISDKMVKMNSLETLEELGKIELP